MESIDAGRLTFRTTDEPRSLPRDELVRWGNPALPRPQTMVLLADGSRIVTAADWSGGAAVRIDGNAVVVRSDTLDETRLPRSRVSGLVFAGRRRPLDRLQLEDEIRGSLGADDQLWLTNRDRLSGRLSELSGGSLALATELGDVKLPLSRVEAIVLGQQGAGSREHRDRALRHSRLPAPGSWLVSLRDGSLLHAEWVEADASKLRARLAGETDLSGRSVADIASIQHRGGRITYLSDLEPAEYRHVPYLDVAWPFERDRNVRGEPLAAGGKPYWKGLGMHSAARLTYRLDGTYRRLDAAVAIDDAADGRGSVVFGVYLLQGGNWEEAYSSGIVRGGDKPHDLSVELAGAQGLTLTVDYADRGDELDYADWLDARLVK